MDSIGARNLTATRDGSKGGQGRGSIGRTLTDAAWISAGYDVKTKLWPTPAASVANDGESPTTWLARAEQLKAKHQNGNGAGMPLTVASAMWCTPTTRDWKDTSGMTYTRKDGRSRVDLLPRQVFYAHSHQDQTTSRDGGDGSATVVLNPQFVETLMGFPIGWTDLGLSATPSCPSKQPKPSDS